MGRTRKHTRRHARVRPRGVLSMTREGYGFVKTAEGEYFIPHSSLGGAFEGDLVEVAPVPSAARRQQHNRHGSAKTGARPEGRIVAVVDRAVETLLGRYEVADPFGVVIPADKTVSYDVFTMRADAPEVPDGALVRVRITQYPTRHSACLGVVEEVVGTADDPASPVELVIARHKLETRFSEGALNEAARACVDVPGALAAGYRDIRHRLIVTIDPADARDFDDALSLEKVPAKESGAGAGARTWLWRLGVHIADVSSYVPWNSSLDLDARRRATSVYLADRVIPMLPEALSNDLCSLKPGCDRRAMTVDLFLDERGRMVSYDIYPSLIRSSLRLSYDQVQEILDDPEAAPAVTARAHGGQPQESFTPAKPADGLAQSVLDLVQGASALAALREAMRREAGGLEFATVEAKVKLDDEGAPVDIVLRRKTPATSLVEEAMILANETVARHLSEARFPCAYRIHERPASDGLAALVPVFSEFPWFDGSMAERLPFGDPHIINAVLRACRGRSEEELVSSLLLRSMKRAVYSPENRGHYGLALKAYAHFTSPIRRYPDLIVHRMLKARAAKRPEKFDQEVNALSWLCEHSSDAERVADDAARESQEAMMAEYLSGFVGTVFSAVVSGVTSRGLFVRLDCTAEGFVPVRSLGDEYFVHDAAAYRLIGSDSGTVWRLGQRVAVRLTAADPAIPALDFTMEQGRDLRFREDEGF